MFRGDTNHGVRKHVYVVVKFKSIITMKNKNILKIYEIAFNNCYTEISKIITLFSNKIYLRKESINEKSSMEYVIEIISPDSQNNDDYGIGINFSINIKKDQIDFEIDVSKSFGPLYLQKSFKIKKYESELDIIEYNESLEWLKLLPDLAVNIYVKDYSI